MRAPWSCQLSDQLIPLHQRFSQVLRQPRLSAGAAADADAPGVQQVPDGGGRRCGPVDAAALSVAPARPRGAVLGGIRAGGSCDPRTE